MFKAIVSAATLRDALDSVSVLVDEYKARLSGENLSIRAVSPANVGMVDPTLDAAASESYEAHGGVIGVNLSRLEEVAGMASAGDLIRLALDEETHKLSIRTDGLSCTLTLIDPDSIRQESDIPDLNLATNIALEGTHLNHDIETAGMVSDHIRLRVDGAEGMFHIEAEGDIDDMGLSLPLADLISIEAGAADSSFSLDYLKDMNKATPTDIEVTVELSEEFPVKLHYQITEEMGTITYILAPHIQSDRADVSAAMSLSGHRAVPLVSLDSH